jgi:hypothetical protein
METNIMISSRLNRRSFCYAAFLAILPATAKKPTVPRSPEPEFKIGDRVKTKKLCYDRISPNYRDINWECGFVIGYVWKFDEWQLEQYRQGWTYWIRYDQTQNEILGDRPWVDFVHHTEVIKV